jgi:hypothetical protein
VAVKMIIFCHKILICPDCPFKLGLRGRKNRVCQYKKIRGTHAGTKHNNFNRKILNGEIAI